MWRGTATSLPGAAAPQARLRAALDALDAGAGGDPRVHAAAMAAAAELGLRLTP
jgi:hypothetical protein